jgi:anti-sigma factor RsiW
MSRANMPEDLISAYLDGECTEAERAAVAARLETDVEWQLVFAEVSAARDVVRALPGVEPPAGFIESLIEAPVPTSSRVRAHRSRRSRTIAGFAAAAAIVVGFVLASPKHDNTRVAPPIATLADSHGATVSLQSDPVSGLAPIAATPGSTEPQP